MRLLAKYTQKRRRGQLYEGPAAWCDDPQIVLRPGFYALSADGKNVLAHVPLVCVDDAPGDPDDGSTHYEYAGPKDYPQRSGGKPLERRANSIVELEADTHGTSGVAA